jgi:hypothetical protein
MEAGILAGTGSVTAALLEDDRQSMSPATRSTIESILCLDRRPQRAAGIEGDSRRRIQAERTRNREANTEPETPSKPEPSPEDTSHITSWSRFDFNNEMQPLMVAMDRAAEADAADIMAVSPKTTKLATLSTKQKQKKQKKATIPPKKAAAKKAKSRVLKVEKKKVAITKKPKVPVVKAAVGKAKATKPAAKKKRGAAFRKRLMNFCCRAPGCSASRRDAYARSYHEYREHVERDQWPCPCPDSGCPFTGKEAASHTEHPKPPAPH